MTRRVAEIKRNFLNYVFTTRLLARFHYVFSGISRSGSRFMGQNEFLPDRKEKGYHDAVSTHLPKATIVYDHFHVIKLFNDKLSDLRRSLYNRAQDEQKKVLKGVRWLLLKLAENLDTERDEQARLGAALRLNKPLALAYYMKQDLRQFWEQPGKKYATFFLNDWIRWAIRTACLSLTFKPAKRSLPRGAVVLPDIPPHPAQTRGARIAHRR